MQWTRISPHLGCQADLRARYLVDWLRRPEAERENTRIMKQTPRCFLLCLIIPHRLFYLSPRISVLPCQIWGAPGRTVFSWARSRKIKALFSSLWWLRLVLYPSFLTQWKLSLELNNCENYLWNETPICENSQLLNSMTENSLKFIDSQCNLS